MATGGSTPTNAARRSTRSTRACAPRSNSPRSRIRAYHEGQLPADRDYTDAAGVRLGARWRPVDAAGLYVPGGRAAYPSSLLMNAIPAKVAGVERLAVVTPTPGGEVNPLVLAAAHLAGVDEIWRIGGAQAVAALAYGTQRIAPVDVITGPGNAWVAEAKRQLFGVVGIDMVAGPSEILVIADGAQRSRLDRRRPAEPGRARSRRAVDPDHRRRRASPNRSRTASTSQLRDARHRARSRSAELGRRTA